MKPILFSSPMVRAIQAGLKTQTRRVVQPQPRIDIDGTVVFPWASFFADGHVHTWDDDGVGGENWWANEYPNENKFSVALSKTEHTKAHPYGRVGDRLWCRETFRLTDETPPWVIYAADSTMRAPDGSMHGHVYQGPWKPSVFMPRWASRITLEIVSVRPERLQDITEEDARAEGVSSYERAVLPGRHQYSGQCVICGRRYHEHVGKCQACPGGHGTIWDQRTYRGGFAFLWDSINAHRANGIYSWGANPWVWRIEFRRVEQ